MKTVCIVSNLFPPRARGGAEQVALLSALGFRDAGYRVIVLTAAPFSGLGSLRASARVEDGLTVYRWFPANLYAYGAGGSGPRLLRVPWNVIDAFNPHSRLVARLILRRERPDHIISHNLKGIGYSLPQLFSSLTMSYIHTPHDVQLAHPSGLLSAATADAVLASPSTRAYMAMTRRLFATVPIAVFPSQFLRDFHEERRFFAGARRAVLPNPVRPAVPARAGAAGGVHVSFIGQLEPHKGLPELLAAWRSPRGATLHIAGSGSLQSWVESRTRADVRFHGRLENGALEALWSTTDVLVLPSLCFENAPTVLSDALVRGIAIVATDTGGTRELADRSSLRWLVPPGDTAALAAALEQAVSTVAAGRRPLPVPLPDPAAYVTALLELLGAERANRASSW